MRGIIFQTFVNHQTVKLIVDGTGISLFLLLNMISDQPFRNSFFPHILLLLNCRLPSIALLHLSLPWNVPNFRMKHIYTCETHTGLLICKIRRKVLLVHTCMQLPKTKTTFLLRAFGFCRDKSLSHHTTEEILFSS